MPGKCPTPIGAWGDPETGRIGLIPCKRWECPHCGNVKKAQLLERAGTTFKGRRVRFWTLTVPLGFSQDHDLMRAWAKLRSLLRHAGYHHFRFFWVKEYTKAGEAHLHALVDAYLPWWLMRVLWAHATEGIANHLWVSGEPEYGGDIKNPAAYAAKYVTKAAGMHMPKGRRRWGASRGFAPARAKRIGSKLRFRLLLPRECIRMQDNPGRRAVSERIRARRESNQKTNGEWLKLARVEREGPLWYENALQSIRSYKAGFISVGVLQPCEAEKPCMKSKWEYLLSL